MADAVIQEGNVSGADVHEFMEGVLLPAIEGHPLDVVCAAFFTTLLLSMHDNLTEEQLVEGVKGGSAWLVCYITSLDMTPGKVN